MNNYLAGIAARTLSPDSPVRPRLPGRFEPASVLLEPSIDSSQSLHPATVKPSAPHSDRDRAAALETTDRLDSDRQPGELFDPALHGYRSAASAVPNNVVEPSPSLSIRAPNRQTMAEPPRQTLNAETHQVAKVVEVTEGVGSRSKTPPAPREESNAEPKVEKIAGKFAHLHYHDADEAAPTIPRPGPKRKKPQSVKVDEQKDVPQPIRRHKAVIERELQTVTIREKPRPGEFERRNESNSPSPPTSDLTSPAARQPDNSKAPPVFIQSRIAPLIEVERLNQSRIDSQPTVHVTIGRLEVRAVQTSQPAARQRAAAPVMNLDDYLKRRSQGGTR